jgi:predicted unusual protein kinase regulating ubiquinone biosynthesis (AarF/ABC1/UbiB family)
VKRFVLGAAALGAVAVLLARRRPGRSAPVLGTNRVTRNAQLATAGTKTGATIAAYRARRVFASADRRRELDERQQLRTAEQVADALGNMKGALMKIGQMMSYLDDTLPEPYRVALAQLQQDAPPMSPALAAQVVERELGAPPDVVFAEWDPVPIASASIGQVHRAMTNDGQAVAVKVQYPGVDEAIRADLDNAGLLFAGMGMMFPGLEPGPIVDEIRARLVEELDYLSEAENQRAFAAYYAGHPFIEVPAVVDRYCSARVFTSLLAEGARFDEMESWSQHERNLAAETIFRFVFRSLYRFHVFNGDPHPGNYLFRPGGRVTFLDFGLVRRFSPAEVSIFERLARTMAVDHDMAAFRRVCEEAGFLAAGAPVSDEQVGDYFGHFYRQVLEHGGGTFDHEYASETVRRLFDVSGPYAEILRAANVPGAFVIIQRINLGLFAILARLHATADWRAIAEELWPFVGAPPSTPLGREEAAWLGGSLKASPAGVE